MSNTKMHHNREHSFSAQPEDSSVEKSVQTSLLIDDVSSHANPSVDLVNIITEAFLEITITQDYEGNQIYEVRVGDDLQRDGNRHSVQPRVMPTVRRRYSFNIKTPAGKEISRTTTKET